MFEYSNFIDICLTSSLICRAIILIGGSVPALSETLEMDVFNRTPSMLMLLRVLDRLHRDISPPPNANNANPEMPPWMRELHLKISSRDAPLNVRAFLGRLVVNRVAVFEPYAAAWWPPLAQLAIDAARFGSGIHYVIQDLVAILVTWSTPQPSGAATTAAWVAVKPSNGDERALASQLVAFLMANCQHPKKV